MKTIVAWTLCAAAAVTWAVPRARADYQAGLDAYAGGEWELAAKELKPVADAGNDTAQFLMGTLHASGSGVEASMAEALRYYRLSAEQDNAEAQAALAFTYRVGNGVAQSYEEAARWYRKAADHGIGDAQFNLGSLSAAGRGVPKSNVEAFKWFSLAAAHGIEDAVIAVFYSMDNLTEEQIQEGLRQVSEWRPVD